MLTSLVTPALIVEVGGCPWFKKIYNVLSRIDGPKYTSWVLSGYDKNESRNELNTLGILKLLREERRKSQAVKIVKYAKNRRTLLDWQRKKVAMNCWNVSLMKYMINQLNMYEFDIDTSITKKEIKPVNFF